MIMNVETLEEFIACNNVDNLLQFERLSYSGMNVHLILCLQRHML